MALSHFWQELPNDLTEQILAQLVNLHFDTDPAYAWVCLRQVSVHQKRVIERRFRELWLPKLSITLYAGARHKFDYAMDNQTSTPNPDSDDWVTFAVQRQVHNPVLGISQDSMPGKLMQGQIFRAWESYDPATARNITVRLGEGYLNGGCRGGHIVNDTDIPGWEFLRNPKGDPTVPIRFPWKDAMNELLREEMYMRRVGDRMFADACSKWRTNNPGIAPIGGKDKLQMPPLNIQVKLWRWHVQCARRVAAFKHRVAKSKASPHPIRLKFAATSINLHKQDPGLLHYESGLRAGYWGSSRMREPDIFEVAVCEESVVPRLGVFQRWLQQQNQQEKGKRGEIDEMNARDDSAVSLDVILDLYRDEFAWTCRLADIGADDDEGEQEQLFGLRETGRGFGGPIASQESLMSGNDRVRWQLTPW